MWKTTIPRSIGAVLLALWIAFVPALASAGGTLNLAPGAEWATPISDAELAEQRGGFGGVAFSVHFEGVISDMSGEGIIHLVGPDGTIPSGVPDPASNPGMVEIRDFVGALGPFTGIGQWAIVNGDGNEVVNNLTVNIFVMDQIGQMSSLLNVLSNGPPR